MNSQPEERHEIEPVAGRKLELEDKQLLEQIYAGAGLEPVVIAGIRDYDEKLQKENKLLNKVLGTRGSDIKGYGEAVAKRVAFAVYQMLNRQYGGKVGDLRQHIMALQEERDLAVGKYDELMGRVVGILGEEFRQLKTDSNTFIQRLTSTLGEDLEKSKINQKALAETLADIDGLRKKISELEAELEKEKEERAKQVEEFNGLNTKLEAQIQELEGARKKVESELTVLKREHESLRQTGASLSKNISAEQIGQKLVGEAHAFLVEDSKVPGLMLKGVDRFVDFKKYLARAGTEGAREALKQSEIRLGEQSSDVQ